jgi:hypothetical protein
MEAIDHFPYRAAATLALDLLAKRPSLSESDAIETAWLTWQEEEREKKLKRFTSPDYNHHVLTEMNEIRAGHKSRFEDPPVLARALKRLGH